MSNLPRMAVALPRPNTSRAAVLVVSASVDGVTLSARETSDALHRAADALLALGGPCLALYTLPAFPEGFDD